MDDRYEYRDGQFVSQKIAQVIEAIHEYSPELEVQWIPEAQRLKGDAAFRIIHHCPNRGDYIIRHVKTEAEMDTRILMELMMGDQRNGKVEISKIEAAEKAAKAVARQKFQDQLEEANEIAASILKSNKSTYKVSKDLIISDYMMGNQATKPKYL